MHGTTRPPRLVDYFLTVGAEDTNNLTPYHRKQQLRPSSSLSLSLSL